MEQNEIQSPQLPTDEYSEFLSATLAEEQKKYEVDENSEVYRPDEETQILRRSERLQIKNALRESLLYQTMSQKEIEKKQKGKKNRKIPEKKTKRCASRNLVPAVMHDHAYIPRNPPKEITKIKGMFINTDNRRQIFVQWDNDTTDLIYEENLTQNGKTLLEIFLRNELKETGKATPETPSNGKKSHEENQHDIEDYKRKQRLYATQSKLLTRVGLDKYYIDMKLSL